MIEIRQIVGVDELNSFLNDTPEVIHVILFDNDKEHAPNCIMENLENLSESKINGALIAVADMNNPENEPLKEAREFFIFPSIEFLKNGKSYARILGHMSEYDFYEVIEDIEDGYYQPEEE